MNVGAKSDGSWTTNIQTGEGEEKSKDEWEMRG